jgi:PAS domain-containing protein
LEDQKGLDFWERIHPEDKPKVNETFDLYLKGNLELCELEIRLSSSLAIWKWVLIRGKVTARDEQGNAIRMTGTMLDVDERKRTFIALQESQERLKILNQQVIIVQEEERRRLSRELHDEAGQALTALKISLELIRDEVLLSFGAIPLGYGMYSLMFGFQPTFLSRFIPPNNEEDMSWPPFCYALQDIYRYMSYPRKKANYECNYKHEYDKEWLTIINAMPNTFMYPVIPFIKDVRSAYKMGIWFYYIIYRDSDDYQQPPIPEHFYMRYHCIEGIDAMLYFRMYDECKNGIIKQNERTLQKCGGKVPPAFLDYLDILERQDYDWVEQYLHKNYDNSLLSIKRKLHLEPDCKGSLWDEANRKPIDIRQVLEEKFRTCVREDYSIASF